MTGPDLHALRRDYVLGNTRKLARLLGCHPSTINRNVLREQVTDYILTCIDDTPTAAAFVRGMQWGRGDRHQFGGI